SLRPPPTSTPFPYTTLFRSEWLRAQGVVALADVDTRALVRRIRKDGVVRCAVGDAPVEELHARALAEPPIDGRPLDRRVGVAERSEEHTSELQSRSDLVCRL